MSITPSEMTLRDYFAAQAMTVVFQDKRTLNDMSAETGVSLVNVAAMTCYSFADAMMRVRELPKRDEVQE